MLTSSFSDYLTVQQGESESSGRALTNGAIGATEVSHGAVAQALLAMAVWQ